MCCFGVPLRPVAEPLDGPWASRVREIAASGRAWSSWPACSRRTVTGCGTRCSRPGPGVEASYDKIHLFDAFGFRESATVAPGIDLRARSTSTACRVGLTTCYDIRFPALFQRLADDGARVIVVAASWGAGPGKREQWELLARARALDSTSYVLACGQADPVSVGRRSGSAPTGIGHSLAVSPLGEVIDSLGPGPGLPGRRLDPAEVDGGAGCPPRAREPTPLAESSGRSIR